ncbi:MAG: MlaD family protein [Planctomycetota bacterium]
MTEHPPEARIERRKRRASLFWVMPLLTFVGLLVVLSIQVSRERGPTIFLTFDDAAALEPGAKIVHRGLSVGVVRDVRLSDTLDRVEVEAELAPHARKLAVEGSEFWIVRPEVSLRGVAGLDTLIGPRYIAVRPGDRDGEVQRRFEGRASAPGGFDLEADGLVVLLRSDTAATTSPGALVLYRGMPVGSVRGVTLADDSTHVRIEAVIERPYNLLVRENTRFWDASGVGLDFGWFSGLSVEAGSLDSVLRGAIALATPTSPGPPVEPGHEFTLAPQAENSWRRWQPEILLDTGE